MSDKPNPKPVAQKPEWKPNVEFFTSMSADGRYIICKTVITAVKPRAYFETILKSAGSGSSKAMEGTYCEPSEGKGADNDQCA